MNIFIPDFSSYFYQYHIYSTGGPVSGLLLCDAITGGPGSGLLLRDRGYAEKAPVAGQFRMDDENGLILTTDYEMMSSLERFWFAGPNLRLRTSTVQGLSNNASFCMETRQLDDDVTGAAEGNRPASAASPFGW